MNASEAYSISSPIAGGEGRQDTWLRRHWDVPLFLSIIIVALVMRLWALDSRFIHYDESLHGYFSWRLSEGQGFQHNPLMHGPFQFLVNAFSFTLFGDSDYTLRLAAALFGTALVALPFFFRRFLGKEGALVVALLLAFSPAMLYFSRFAREDMIMVFWTLGLVLAIWRYIDEERPIYLYLLAALLAFSFATKETSYIHLGIIGSFLFILALPDLVPWLLGRHPLARFSPPGVAFLLLATLSLPHWAPLLGYLAQGPMRITLINKDVSLGAVGAPLGKALFEVGDITVTTGMVMATVLVMVLGIIGASIGVAWNKRQWLTSAAVFYSIWLLLFSTVFTNPEGIASGIWQSMGYWIVQHNTCRLCQPWYYYFTLTSVYEFLPLLFALGAFLYYIKRGTLFTLFLFYWAVLAFLVYSVAGERAPWLLVNIVLPVIVLAGKFLGDLIALVPWRRAWQEGGLVAIPMVALFILLLTRLVFYEIDMGDYMSLLAFFGLLLLALGVAIGFLVLSLRAGPGGLGLVGVGLAIFLMVFTVRAGWRASYHNDGVPTEMLIYAQIYPQASQFTETLERVVQVTGKRENLKIAVDPTGAFAWPMYWKLRHFKDVQYTCYGTAPGCSTPSSTPQVDALLVHADNESSLRLYLGEGFTPGERIPYLGWFPEIYRVRSPKDFFEGLKDRGAWRRALDYWLYRKLGTAPLSGDAYIHFSTSLPGISRP